MDKKEENNKDLKKPDPLAYKNWSELIKPTKIDVNKEEQKDSGSVTIEPLERGYGLTMFLVLVATYSAVQFLNNPRWMWGSLLAVTGLAMAMTVPSNLFFLGGLPS